jgi:hypothetical protein
MKKLNSQASSIKMVHCNVNPQHGSDDCGLFVLGYVIALSELQRSIIGKTNSKTIS